MQTRTQIVKDHFNETDNYLKNNLVIILRSKLIKENLPALNNKDILDIGCGNGDLTLPYIKDNKITFLDLSDKMLEIVRSNTPVEYYGNAEFLNIDFDNFTETKKYDYIFVIGVLAHVNSLEKAFSRFTGLLNRDGILIIQFTNSQNILSIIIRFISGIKSVFRKRLEYKVNYTPTQKIAKELRKNKLKSFKMVSYWPSLPGFRLLPLSIRKIVYFKLLNGRLLRSLGGEILLFIKLGKD